MANKYYMPEATQRQIVEDMHDLAIAGHSNFSTPEVAAQVLAELVIQDGERKHAVSLGQLSVAVVVLRSIDEMMRRTGVTNESAGEWLFEYRASIKRALGMNEWTASRTYCGRNRRDISVPTTNAPRLRTRMARRTTALYAMTKCLNYAVGAIG